MPLQGVSTETSTMSGPDLSLHISPPTGAPPPSSGGTAPTDLWRRIGSFFPRSEGPETSAGLSFPRSNGQESSELPWRTAQILQPSRRTSHEDFITERMRPIRGIPVYHTSPFPFNTGEPKTGFRQQMPSCSSNFEAVGLNSYNHHSHHRSAGESMSLLTREDQYRLQQQAQQQFAIGSYDGSLRSRFAPKLPSKRSTRAPRMRWTSSLHARFVRAVELLGGHESLSLPPST